MKCAVSDFDRTLFVDGQVSEENRKAVEQWQREGNLFYVATGRNLASIQEQLVLAGLMPDGLILNNGAAITDKEGTLLFSCTIEKKAALEILQFLHELDGDGSGVSMLDKKVNILSSSGTTTQKPCSGVYTIDQVDSLEDILQIHRRRKDEAYIQQLCRKINERFLCVSAFPNVWNADIVARGVDKGNAVQWILEHEPRITQVRVMGDSANDLGMIRKFHGAAPSWASLPVRQAASSVVESVAEFLESCGPVCTETYFNKI